MTRPYRRWTADDTARLRRLARAGWTQVSIAEDMCRDQAQISRKMADLRIPTGVSAAAIAAFARAAMRRRMAA